MKISIGCQTICVCVILAAKISSAQCHYIPVTSVTGDTLTYTFGGGGLASFGCAPIDPTYWMSGSGAFVQVDFVSPEDYPKFRVWGMNDDDSASVSVNGVAYPLSSSTASYDPKVVCGQSPGPDGIIFANGKVVGANDNVEGNYSYQEVSLNTTNVTSFTVTGVSGAGWGYAGVYISCPLTVSNVGALELNIFPNPANETISFGNKPADNADVKIYNALGQCVLKTNTADQFVDISALSNGIYLMTVSTNKQNLAKRFTKV